MHENINSSNVKIKFYHFTRFSDCTQQWGIKCLIVIMLLLKRFIHTSGDVPSDWRHANVTPIFKKGVKSNPGNYRPISLTSIPCKLFESLIKDGITEHLSVNALISASQHGFTKSKSCLTNLEIGIS